MWSSHFRLTAPLACAFVLSFSTSEARGGGEDLWMLGSPCDLYRVDRATTSSSRCFSCHDGSVQSQVPHGRAGLGDGMHAVGVSYWQASGEQRLRLNPAAMLPSEIVLIDGKVECTSCHAGDGEGRARTAMTMDRSRLCLACHNK